MLDDYLDFIVVDILILYFWNDLKSLKYNNTTHIVRTIPVISNILIILFLLYIDVEVFIS